MESEVLKFKWKDFFSDIRELGWKGVWLFNYLPNDRWSNGDRLRYFGFSYDWYDGPIYTFGFWWFNIGIGPVYNER